jgi:hypothetical protein
MHISHPAVVLFICRFPLAAIDHIFSSVTAYAVLRCDNMPLKKNFFFLAARAHEGLLKVLN